MARTGDQDANDTREARLKAALKANMGRRKAQVRAKGLVPNSHGRKPGTRADEGAK